MAKKGNKKNRQMIQIEILQNGISMESFVRPFKKTGKITISAHKGDLVLPHYPLADDLVLLETDGKIARLIPDPQMSGFVTQAGELTDLAHEHFSTSHLVMKPGDYGSIQYRDLVILLKIGVVRKRPERKINIDPRYRGDISSNFFANRFESRQFWLSGLIALLIVAGIGGLALKITKPKTYTRLNIDPAFQLGIISPDLIATAPEALQFALNRGNYLGSTLNYYDNLANVYTGLAPAKPSLLYGPSTARYENAHSKYEESLQAMLDNEKKLSRRTLSRRGAGMIAIPAVIGESALTKTLRTIDKFDLRIKAYRSLLDDRQKTTEEFTNDEEYPFNEYKNVSRVDKAKDMLSQISPFNLLTDERDMYFQARRLSLMGRYRRKQIEANSVARLALDDSNYRPIRIVSTAPFINVTNPSNERLFNKKMKILRASDFTKKAPQKIREPLVGEMDPKLVERVINKGQFELQLCYELALRRDSATEGTVEWSWRVNSRGNISEVELVSSTIRDSDMINCLKRKISTWRFPRPVRGSVLIRYPFAFTPRKG